MARFSEPMSFVSYEVTPANPDQAAQSGLALRERFETDGAGGRRTILSSRTPSGLLLDTAYAVRFNAASSPGFGRLPGSQDLSGEVLDAASTVTWTFRTSAVRIDSPRYNDSLSQSPISASGLVAVAASGVVTVELRTTTDELISGPVTAQRSSQTVSSGGAPANPWSASLAVPTAHAGPFKIIAVAGQNKDTVVFARVPDIVSDASFRSDAIVEHRAPGELVRRVTRDNPGITGIVDLQPGERARASAPWSHNGEWTGLGGKLHYERQLFSVDFFGVEPRPAVRM